jgi:ABC-type antimicrobial peptide transport system permease subunit
LFYSIFGYLPYEVPEELDFTGKIIPAHTKQLTFSTYPVTLLKDFTIYKTLGLSNLKDNEAYISKAFEAELNILESDYPYVAEKLTISGTVYNNITILGSIDLSDDPESYYFIYALYINDSIYNDYFERRLSFNYINFSSNDYEKTYKELLELDLECYSVSSSFKDALSESKDAIKVNIITNLGLCFLFFFISALGFYFLIRSSMISRVYDVMIYRCLGTKKSHIFIEYLFEIIIITTLTTVLGFVIMNVIFYNSQDSLLAGLNVISYNILSTVIGFIAIYVFNIIGGMSSVFFLLRKTPSEIASMYDM